MNLRIPVLAAFDNDIIWFDGETSGTIDPNVIPVLAALDFEIICIYRQMSGSAVRGDVHGSE